jgi:hypothetical protein
MRKMMIVGHKRYPYSQDKLKKAGNALLFAWQLLLDRNGTHTTGIQ